MSNLEQTLSIIKPDAVERNLDSEIKSFFEKNNLKIIKSKKVKISKEEASEFYKVHQTKPFYDELCNYLSLIPSQQLGLTINIHINHYKMVLFGEPYKIVLLLILKYGFFFLLLLRNHFF